MSCYSPLTAYRGPIGENGKRAILWQRPGDALEAMPLSVPCGKCVGCLSDRAQMWAVRCVHESQMHAENAMVTLTYDENHLPTDGSLNHDHFRDFLDRLKYQTGRKARFFMAGEYGSNGGRPHYHALLFGHSFPDQKLLYRDDKISTFVSDQLTSIWKRGFTTVQPVNYGTASYVARYCLKKAGARSGENGRRPEYASMSKRPGIGSTWYDKFKSDIFPHDKTYSGEFTVPTPRYYSDKLAKADPCLYDQIKARRFNRASLRKVDSFDRDTKQFLAIEKVSKSKRNYEG